MFVSLRLWFGMVLFLDTFTIKDTYLWSDVAQDVPEFNRNGNTRFRYKIREKLAQSNQFSIIDVWNYRTCTRILCCSSQRSLEIEKDR